VIFVSDTWGWGIIGGRPEIKEGGRGGERSGWSRTKKIRSVGYPIREQGTEKKERNMKVTKRNANGPLTGRVSNLKEREMRGLFRTKKEVGRGSLI